MPTLEITAMENGPDLVKLDGKVEMALCRCGQSQHKPLCDGSHARVGFKAPMEKLPLLQLG